MESDEASPVVYNKYNRWVLGEDFPNEKQERYYSLLELKEKINKLVTSVKKRRKKKKIVFKYCHKRKEIRTLLGGF